MQLRTQQVVDKYLGGLAIALLRPATMLLGALLRRNHELTVGEEVVWVKMLGGGSLILAMPALLGFRAAHPNTRMVLVTTPSVKPFAELIGVFDEYRLIDNRGSLRLISSAWRTLAKTMGADCVIDLEVHSRLTTVFATLTMARNRVSYWLEDIFWRKGLASHLIFFNRSSGSFLFYDRIAKLFGVPIAGQLDCRAAIQRACADVPRPVAVAGQVCVGFACSDLGQERMLSAEQWTFVFQQQLRPEHRRFVFLGGPADRERAESIIERLRPRYPQLEFENSAGKLTLAETAAIVLASPEFWGIDSSLLHIARIGGLRCLSYWGPTDPSTRLRAGWVLNERVFYNKVACSPCVHTSEMPPCRGDNRCIKSLFKAGATDPFGWTPIEYPGRRRASA
jgi:ADP-heptose:LPS heptosyltransferase